MRQIKFRAWDSVNVEMYPPEEIIYLTGNMTEDLQDSNSCLILEQFTGLKDKNGKEIYEGDIVEQWVSAPWDEDIPIKVKGIITFSDPFEGCFCFRNGENTCCIYETVNLSVIGNIHENPELIN